jgi:hypothetical protein
MGVADWISQHWLDVLQSIGIISGFWFTAHTIRKEGVARQIGNLLTITQQHHSIWKELYDRPHLSRILDSSASLEAVPITHEEKLFVTMLVIHLDGVHRAMKAKMFIKLEGLRKDIENFFSLPIPRAVWKDLKPLQDRDFVNFIENCLNDSGK